MAKLKVDQFVDLVKRSGLVDNERLTQALSGVDQSVKDSGIVASNLTKAGLLTEWQSEKLLQGRHKGFYLGKYKLLNHIGTGGMGSVYLAEHRVMRHRVAIKLLPSHLAAHTSYLERFHQEARASATLIHPNMVRAHDVDHEGNIHYLVMDYVDGLDLQAIVSRNGPLPYRTAAEYTRQAAEGLAYAHRSGLIHRDIKPANLLIDQTGTVKILDMGLARFSDETQGSLTMAYDQKMIGTVDYLAPEQALDSHKVDARVDVYSLGCTLYFMLAGDSPFPQGTIPQRLMQHQSAEPTDIRKFRPDAPQGLIDICLKMMAKSADDRYQTADDVAAALAEWLGDGGLKSGESGVITKPPPRQPSPGPSQNEDLMLAPLDDEPAARRAAASSAQETKAGESKISKLAAKSTVKKTEPSGVKKSEPSSAKNGEPSTTKPVAKPKSTHKTTAPPMSELAKTDDLMDELLSASDLPSTETLPSTPLATTRKQQQQAEERVLPLWLVIGLGIVGGGIIVVILLLISWLAGGL
jgi:serine/threonine protein kinase